MHERLDQPPLLAVARRQLPERPAQVGVEPLGERVANAALDTAPQLRKVVEHGGPAEPRIEREAPGQAADPAPYRAAAGAAVEVH